MIWNTFRRAYPSFTIDVDEVRRVREQVLKRVNQTYAKNDNPWELEGPTNIGGRVTDVARHPTDSETFYIACSVGGVFKTTDGGASWTPIFDDVISMSIGNIAVSSSDPNIIYVGTGEANGSASSGAFIGTGVWRSDDGGDTWTQAGLENSNHIARLIIDKDDPDVVYAAATGILYGKGTDRGLYKTTDGGANWEQLHFVSDSTACIDVVVHPENPDVIYTSMWERQRYAWIRDYGGPTSGIYKTVDGGANWERLENGIEDDPDQRGRIGLSMSPTNPDVVYACFTENEITNSFHAVYKTENGGEEWENVSGDLPSNTFSSFGWFFGNIRVDPVDDDKAYVLGLNAFRTDSSGGTWNRLNGMHVDMHGLDFFPGNTDDIVIVNDGGVYRSLDAGETISFVSNIPITQFYNIEVDFQNPNKVLGGTQDNNTLMRLTTDVSSYVSILGGDGFHVHVDPVKDTLVYAEFQWGNLFKSTEGGFNMQRAMEGLDVSDRTNWNTPVILSPIDPSIVFYGSNKLYTSFEAEEWTAISGDLTKGQHPSGSIAFGTLTTIAPSYQNQGTIYTGSDDGEVYITRSGGLDWTLINDGLPNRFVTKVSVNPFDDSEAIVTFSGYTFRDFEPHIFITNDYGETWTSISGNLPDFPINDIEYDPMDDQTLYIASDYGVWYSTDKGLNWELLGDELPLTIVKDIKIHAPTQRLYAGTFGRSIYSVDISESVSTDDLASTEGFTVFPNPAASGQPLTIESDQRIDEIRVFDLNGRLMQRNSGGKSVTINEVGIYVIEIRSGDRTYAEQVTVVR